MLLNGKVCSDLSWTITHENMHELNWIDLNVLNCTWIWMALWNYGFAMSENELVVSFALAIYACFIHCYQWWLVNNLN